VRALTSVIVIPVVPLCKRYDNAINMVLLMFASTNLGSFYQTAIDMGFLWRVSSGIAVLVVSLCKNLYGVPDACGH